MKQKHEMTETNNTVEETQILTRCRFCEKDFLVSMEMRMFGRNQADAHCCMRFDGLCNGCYPSVSLQYQKMAALNKDPRKQPCTYCLYTLDLTDPDEPVELDEVRIIKESLCTFPFSMR